MRVASQLILFGATVAAGDDLHFLVMGDWGGSDHSPYTHDAEVRTAKSMNNAASHYGAQFTLALGDNFYYSGVKHSSDKRFKDTFEDCFDGSHLQSPHTFHILAGNHDHYGTVQAQIDYSSKSQRWSFPSLYYTFTKTAPDGATVQIVYVDTVSLAGNSQLNDRDVGGLLGSEMPGPPNLTAASSQLSWVDSTLANSNADYVIVAGHYCVESAAEHGPVKHMSHDYFPALRKYRAHAYFCGHDHAEQHIDVGDGVQYHNIGSANLRGKWSHTGNYHDSQMKFKALTTGGYAVISASKSGMVVKHFDGQGSLMYTAPTMKPRGSQPPVPPSPSPSPGPSPDDRRRRSSSERRRRRRRRGNVEYTEDTEDHEDAENVADAKNVDATQEAGVVV